MNMENQMTRIQTTFALTISALFSLSTYADPIVINDVSQLDFEGDFVYAVNINDSGKQIISGFNVNTTWGGASHNCPRTS